MATHNKAIEEIKAKFEKEFKRLHALMPKREVFGMELIAKIGGEVEGLRFALAALGESEFVIDLIIQVQEDNAPAHAAQNAQFQAWKQQQQIEAEGQFDESDLL